MRKMSSLHTLEPRFPSALTASMFTSPILLSVAFRRNLFDGSSDVVAVGGGVHRWSLSDGRLLASLPTEETILSSTHDDYRTAAATVSSTLTWK